MDTQDHQHEPEVREGYACAVYPVRWQPYKPGALTRKKGRWQRMNEYGGWDNCEKPTFVLTNPPTYEQIDAARDLHEAAKEYHDAICDGQCNVGIPGFDYTRLDRAETQLARALRKAEGRDQ